MTYATQTWVDDVPTGTGTVVDAAHMNHIESGLSAADIAASAAIPKPATPTTDGPLYWNGSQWVSAKLTLAQLAFTGTPNGSKFLRDDGSWQTPVTGTTLAYGTSLPGSPVDGQEAVLVDSTTNPTYQWRFRYNAGSSSAYKWEFVGGAPAYASVSTSESTSTTGSWLDLATVGPLVTLPRAGDYLCEGAAYGTHTINATVLSIGVANGAIASPWGMQSVVAGGGNSCAFSTSAYRFNGVAAASDLRLRYLNSAAGTGTWAFRWLRVTPVRVS